jgi:hypothetical protein
MYLYNFNKGFGLSYDIEAPAPQSLTSVNTVVLIHSMLKASMFFSFLASASSITDGRFTELLERSNNEGLYYKGFLAFCLFLTVINLIYLIILVTKSDFTFKSSSVFHTISTAILFINVMPFLTTPAFFLFYPSFFS